MDRLQIPLRGIVGAADYALGNTPAKSLGEAMTYNALEAKRTAGNILKDAGLPGIVSAPLGFMLDVAFDPINWATLGTAAIVPRTFVGAGIAAKRGGIQAGLKAARAGAESRALEGVLTARNVGRFVGGKLLPATGSKAALKVAATEAAPGRLAKLSKALESRSIKSATEYDDLIGRDFLGTIAGRGNVPFLGNDSPYKLKFGELAREGVKGTSLENFFKAFDYNNAEWTRTARIKDILMKTIGTDEDMSIAVKTYIKSVEGGMSRKEALALVKAESAVPGKIRSAPGSENVLDFGDEFTSTNLADSELDKALSALPGIKGVVDDVSSVPDVLGSPNKFITTDHVENARRLAQEQGLLNEQSTFIQDLKNILEKDKDILGGTGLEWYDKMKSSAKNFRYEVNLGGRKVELGKKLGQTLDVYEAFIALFKRGAVGGSPSAWLNAAVGNPTMGWMGGLNILDPLFMKRIKNAASIKMGNKGSELILGDFLVSSESLKVMGTNPSFFRATTGLNPTQLHSRNILDKLVGHGRDAGLIGDNTDLAEVAKATGMALDEINDSLASFGMKWDVAQLEKAGEAVRAKGFASASRDIRTRISAGEKITSNVSTEMGEAEFFDSDMANKALIYIEKRAKEGNLGFKLLDISFNRMADGYGGIDQSFKLGTTMYAMLDGLTSKELTVIARSINIDPSDLTKITKDGITRYQLSGFKALELSNEIYLNYAAMPSAIRALRNAPLIGSPFASFAYGMGLKTVKTAAYNPASFNRTSFALSELGGDKSPIEKGVLSDPRYQYLSEPGMLKLPSYASSPFFQKNSMYLNVANMIPYYSFNMFNPPERRYSDLYSNALVGTIDKTPFLKDPVGSAIFDNFIQPMILKDVMPQGSFGQPIYPQDASIKERIGYFTRSIAEPLVPGFWRLSAPIAKHILPEKIPFTDTPMTEAIPSYRFRRLSNALEGKTALGTKGREEPLSRTVRAVAGTFGVPIQAPLPLTFIPKELKKKLKKEKKS